MLTPSLYRHYQQGSFPFIAIREFLGLGWHQIKKFLAYAHLVFLLVKFVPIPLSTSLRKKLWKREWERRQRERVREEKAREGERGESERGWENKIDGDRGFEHGCKSQIPFEIKRSRAKSHLWNKKLRKKNFSFQPLYQIAVYQGE